MSDYELETVDLYLNCLPIYNVWFIVETLAEVLTSCDLCFTVRSNLSSKFAGEKMVFT